MAKNGNIHPTRIFREPSEMQKAWEKYKDSLKKRAKEWPKVQYVGKNGDRKEDYPKLPLTLSGFKVFCWDEKIGGIEQYFVNEGGYYEDFVSICARIKMEIRDDQITGGLNGFYNPSITQRLNSLTDKSEVKQIKEQPLFDEDGEND